jgi:hypothetical protein
MEEYRAALSAEKPPKPERFAPFTYDALIASFYRTPRWIDSKDSTQRTYRNIIERFRAKNGTKDVRRVTTENIERKLAGMRDTPAAANNLRKVLARLHRHAIKLGWRQDNPVEATDAARTGRGFHAWTEEEIDAFDARWPFGTRASGEGAVARHGAASVRHPRRWPRRSDRQRAGAPPQQERQPHPCSDGAGPH